MRQTALRRPRNFLFIQSRSKLFQITTGIPGFDVSERFDFDLYLGQRVDEPALPTYLLSIVERTGSPLFLQKS